MNALKPRAPSRHSPGISGSDGRVSAPQRPKSTTASSRTRSRFSANAWAVIGSGIVSGCSTIVVIPPAAAAIVPVA